MTNSDQETLVLEEFKNLKAAYNFLRLSQDNSGIWIIRGTLSFTARYNEPPVEISDKYVVKVELPKKYPRELPRAKETAGRIPSDFHRNHDDSLCLGSRLKVWEKFKKDPTLIGFVKNLLIGYLYSFSHLEEYGRLPFGELSHFGEGVLESYQKRFNVTDNLQVIGLLKFLIENNCRSGKRCPCKSGRKLKKCHGKQLLGILNFMPITELLKDYHNCVNHIGESNIPTKFLSKFLKEKLTL